MKMENPTESEEEPPETVGKQTIDLDAGIGSAINDIHDYLDFYMFREEDKITIQDNIMARKQKNWARLKHVEHDQKGADVLQSSLEKFRDELVQIENHSEDLLEELTSKWENGQQMENFLGIRFEVEIASLLITENYGFRNPDPPDFKIIDSDTNLECTSIKAEEGNEPYENIDFNKMLRRKIREKVNQSNLKREYQELDKNRTVLLIDITNLYFHYNAQENQPDIAESIETCFSQLQNYDWGSIVLINHAGDKERNYRMESYRIDNLSLNPESKAVLDQLFPQSRNFTKHSILPAP